MSASTEQPSKRAGLGHRPAVIVVDLARSVADEAVPGHLPAAVEAAAETALLVEHARALEVPVLYTLGGRRWCTSRGSGLSRAERGAWLLKNDLRDESTETAQLSMQIAPLVRAHPSEIVVRKRAPSAFFGTPLASLLQTLGVDSLIMCGVTTSGCLRASVVDAFSFGYAVNVPRECVADKDTVAHEESLRTMDRKYADVEDVVAVRRRLEAAVR